MGVRKTKGPEGFCPIKQQEDWVFPLVAWERKGWDPGTLGKRKDRSWKREIWVRAPRQCWPKYTGYCPLCLSSSLPPLCAVSSPSNSSEDPLGGLVRWPREWRRDCLCFGSCRSTDLTQPGGEGLKLLGSGNGLRAWGPGGWGVKPPLPNLGNTGGGYQTS